MKSEPNKSLAKKDNDEELVMKGLVLKEMLKKIEEKIDTNDSNFLRTLKTMINDDKDAKTEEKPKKRR